MFNIKHQNTIENAVKANHERAFYSQYPEHPKAYGENAAEQGENRYKALLQQPFKQLLQTGETSWAGEEVSPYTQEALGITYPIFSPDELVHRAIAAAPQWRNTTVDVRADILVETLEAVKERFFDIAYATMHTTGQSFMMSFQASGPHANDRALEAIAMGYHEGNRYPASLMWEKPMGKTSLQLKKNFRAIPKGVGLVIGCSTFPVWNSLPGIYADLVTGNPVIVKPHPKAILPIAIVVAAIQQVLQEKGFSPALCQLAADTSTALITKTLCEHPGIQLIDYTGGSAFGNYVEALKNKTVFTEKAGVNSVIIDSVADIDAVMQNLAFSVSLYSGQMCTAPQNFFIPAEGITTSNGRLSFDEVVQKFKDAVVSLVNNPKMGAGTLGALQNENTLERAHNAGKLGAKVILEGQPLINEEFTHARGCTPSILEVSSNDKHIFEQELFGPVLLLIKTKDTHESIQLARQMAQQHGAITCAAYTTSPEMKEKITEEMNGVFTPVSFNFTGFIWVNQHAAFSDFHVTGGNPAGNASFTNPEFILRRFVWVGNREVAGS
ncbi:phenylacetic acid degradation protein PaaN [Chitinophaga pinensis]|uniref:Phenylacetic acid degradation protein paaN n=1 Tax=Chitinophaga pinensis (strain ATCC 43595 / DSM 2588 / LMG 13176 / NBRC 15968 / NCIMB 11800 / UQM 2034) TaxID=485918 RepID=A0A979G0N1_CHIPD|nr:phenylacetic acid degradation protein PaaN [Chitinophaga pinensis]ACU58634.1 phenylacetic acid degradation protein paaN [Chitinophaga pinensis DSM 2588]